ncbi:hypothetical protein AA313_de0201853 [Arthrobotrys entomopaga]|nr:hypothetical protein AA313_de0201853 [Arthrobotrys entomopaga]
MLIFIASPPAEQYYGQAHSPTLGVPMDGSSAAHRTHSYGSTSTDSDFSSQDSDLAGPRPAAYTFQGQRAAGGASNIPITPATGAIASRIPKGHDLHSDPEDFSIDDYQRKKMEAAAYVASRGMPPPLSPHSPQHRHHQQQQQQQQGQFAQHSLPRAQGFEQHPLPPVPVEQRGYQNGGGYGGGQQGRSDRYY